MCSVQFSSKTQNTPWRRDVPGETSSPVGYLFQQGCLYSKGHQQAKPPDFPGDSEFVCADPRCFGCFRLDCMTPPVGLGIWKERGLRLQAVFMWKYRFLSSIHPQESQIRCVFWSVIMAEQLSLAQDPKQNRVRSVCKLLSSFSL